MTHCAHWEVCRIAWDLMYCPADKVMNPDTCEYDSRSQNERNTMLDEVIAILDVRKGYMEELSEELRNPAVAKHSLQQIEIIRYRVDALRDKQGESSTTHG